MMARVLIIDDDDMFCRLFSSVLERDGYEVAYAHDLADGMQLVRTGSFDVVYLDVRLPDGNGLDKLSEIRAVASSPEVIIITGGGTADSAELAIQSGAWDYIQKPSPLSVIKLPLIRAIQYRDENLHKSSPGRLLE